MMLHWFNCRISHNGEKENWKHLHWEPNPNHAVRSYICD